MPVASTGAVTTPDPDRSPLEDSLQDLFRGAAPPPEVGETLARAARERSRELTVARWRRRLVPIGLAAAASLAGVVALQGTGGRGERPTAPSLDVAGIDPADVDASGNVDVWDAYLLARAAESGAAELRFDLDGDGAVTRADADLVARRAVEVPR